MEMLSPAMIRPITCLQPLRHCVLPFVTYEYQTSKETQSLRLGCKYPSEKEWFNVILIQNTKEISGLFLCFPIMQGPNKSYSGVLNFIPVYSSLQ